MASLPGFTLEDYLAWNWGLVVEGQGEANFSRGTAELLGTVKPRPRLSKVQFGALVALYEAHREVVENMLLDYDEEKHGSWRTYGCIIEDYLDPSIEGKAATLLQGIIEAH